MTKLQIEATGIIFDNIENIMPDYRDFGETKRSLTRLKRYLTEKYFDKDAAETEWMDTEDIILETTEKFERQGFCFGYWLAEKLMGNE